MLVSGYKRERDEKSSPSPRPMYVWHGAVVLSRGSWITEHRLEWYIWDKIILRGIVSIR